MKRALVSLAMVLSSVVACGGSKDSGLFSANGGDTSSGSDAGGKDSATSGGDDQTQDSAVPPADDASTGADTSTGADAAPPPPVDASTCPTDKTNGEIDFSVEQQEDFSLGNTTWSQHGQNGADYMQAVYGEKCDGQVNLTAPNHAGAFDVTKRVISAGVLDNPVIEFARINGDTYVAGYDSAQGCSPCGSGTITVTDFATGKVSGTFDVNARKAGSGQERRFVGTFSFHH